MTSTNLKLISPAPYFRNLISTPSSTDADKVINIQTSRMAMGLVSSALLGARSTQLGEIENLYQTRNYKGWDGYDSEPITQTAKNIAEKIINMLPLEISAPDIVPTCNGGYSIEWKKEKKYLVIEIENKEVSCVLINAQEKKKKTSFTEQYNGEYEDFAKWIRDEFPLNG